jgi:hypothetical protein
MAIAVMQRGMGMAGDADSSSIIGIMALSSMTVWSEN